MKRAVAAFALAAGLGGCMSTPKAPTSAYPESRGAAPDKGVVQAGGKEMKRGNVMHAAAYGVDGVTTAGMTDRNVRQVNGGGHQLDPQTYGPTQRGIATFAGHGGIMPAPQMGPWGAVALVPGAASGPAPQYANGRTSINFISTPSTSKMRVAFQTPTGFVDVLAVPQHYNFAQGNVYRLRLTNIPNRPEAVYFPTLEVYPATKDTLAFQAHSAVPVGFTDEDFDQVRTGNMVVKVIYLPSAPFQDVAAAEEIVSTRLEPGADPVVEATRRGTVLAVVRMGNVNLENPNSPAMDAPTGFGPGFGPAGPGGPLTPAPMPDLKGEPKRTNRDLPADLPPIVLPKK